MKNAHKRLLNCAQFALCSAAIQMLAIAIQLTQLRFVTMQSAVHVYARCGRLAVTFGGIRIVRITHY